MHCCNFILDFFNPQSEMSFHYLMPQFNDPHTHNYFEAFLITEGEVIHHINGQKILLKKGSLNLIRPFDCHEFIPVEGSRPMLINIMATPDRLKKILDIINGGLYDILTRRSSHISLQLSQRDYDTFFEMLNKYLINGESKHQESIISLYICEVIKICYLKYYSEINNSASPPEREYPQWLKLLLVRLREPKNFELPLEELLSEVHFSRMHINRLFKQYLHEPPAHYYNKIKLDYACNLLASTNLTILDIASKIGYSSLSHFYNLFKKAFGLTPKEYRKKHSKLPPPPIGIYPSSDS